MINVQFSPMNVICTVLSPTCLRLLHYKLISFVSINLNKIEMNLKDILSQADKPVLLQFFADWCGPCKMLTRMIDESVEEITQHVELKRIDVDQHPEISAQFHVRAIPTMVVVNKEGEVLWRHTGVMEVRDIISEIRK